MWSRLGRIVASRNSSGRNNSIVSCHPAVPWQSAVATTTTTTRPVTVQTFTSLTIRPFRNLEGRICQNDYKQSFLLRSGNQNHYNVTSMIATRNMGGGPRNEEHKERIRAIRKARKVYFESLPERPPKPGVCTKHYDELLKWKSEPISKKIEHRVVHICSFIIYSWLNAYPLGASIRKLQRDIAFRMQRKHRLPGKLPFQAIMPILGKLENENYLSIKMKTNGRVLIYRDKEKNITPEGQTEMGGDLDDENNNDGPDDEEEASEEVTKIVSRPVDKKRLNIPLHVVRKEAKAADRDEIKEDPTRLSRPIPDDQVPYEKLNYRPKFSKEQKPKVKKIKTKKVKIRSDPVMEPVELPPNTIATSRGPRIVVVNDAADTTSITSSQVTKTTTTTTTESQAYVFVNAAAAATSITLSPEVTKRISTITTAEIQA